MKPRSKQMKTLHRHYEAIIAYANGAAIEMQESEHGTWRDITNPSWYDYMEYRIKPTPKPDIVRYVRSTKDDDAVWFSSSVKNLKLTFDGETRFLKSAEVL